MFVSLLKKYRPILKPHKNVFNDMRFTYCSSHSLVWLDRYWLYRRPANPRVTMTMMKPTTPHEAPESNPLFRISAKDLGGKVRLSLQSLRLQSTPYFTHSLFIWSNFACLVLMVVYYVVVIFEHASGLGNGCKQPLLVVVRWLVVWDTDF